MQGNKKRLKKLLSKAMIVLVTLSLLFTAVACRNNKPIQEGNLSQEAILTDLNIKGDIVFTINNESGTEAEAMAPQAVASAFMKEYPGTRVTVAEVSRGNYPAQIASNEIGDVFWCDEADAHRYQSEHNALMPLDAYIKPLGIDTLNVYSGALKAGMIDGRLYMAPRKLGQQVLIFNRSATTEAGMEVPLKDAIPWEEFKTMCRQLTTDLDGDGDIDQVGAAFKVWWSPIWIAFCEGWGGTWIDSENKTITLASDPLVMRGITELVEAMREGWLYPEDMGYSPSYGTLAETNYIFRTFGTFTWLTRYGNTYDAAKIDWDFCPFPQLPVHKVGAGSTGYVVFNRTDNPDTAAAFALFFLTEDGQRAYHSQSGGATPLLKTLAVEDFWRAKNTAWEDKNFDAFISYPDATTPATVIVQAPASIAEMFSAAAMQNIFMSLIKGSGEANDLFMRLETRANQEWASLIS